MNYETLKDLTEETTEPSNGDLALTGGYRWAGDGGHGKYQWDASSTEMADGGSIIKLDDFSMGRFKLIHEGRVNVKQFGAYGNATGATPEDDYQAFQDAHDFIFEEGGGIVFVPPSGNDYLIGSTVICKRGVTWKGIPRKSILKSKITVLSNPPDTYVPNYTDDAFFRADKSAAEGDFYASNDDGYFRFIDGLTFDLSASGNSVENGPRHAMIGFYTDRHFSDVQITNWAVVGNTDTSVKQVGFWSFHSDSSNTIDGLYRQNFPYHAEFSYCEMDHLYGPAQIIMQGSIALERRANNNFFNYCRFANFNRAVYCVGITNKMYGCTLKQHSIRPLLPEPNPNKDLDDYPVLPIQWDKAEKRFRSLDLDTGVYSDSGVNGKYPRVDFREGYGNSLDSNWFELAAFQGPVVAVGSKTGASTIEVPSTNSIIQDVEQIIDAIEPNNYKCKQEGATDNKIRLENLDVVANFPVGINVRLVSRDPDDRDGANIIGESFLGESYAKVTAVTLDNNDNDTVITIDSASVSAQTGGIQVVDYFEAMSTSQIKIKASSSGQFIEGRPIYLLMPDHGWKSSTIASTPVLTGTDLVINLVDPIATGMNVVAGQVYVGFDYPRTPFKYRHESYFPTLEVGGPAVLDGDLMLTGDSNSIKVYEEDETTKLAVKIDATTIGGSIFLYKFGAINHTLSAGGTWTLNAAKVTSSKFIWRDNDGDDLFTIVSEDKLVNIAGTLQINGTEVLNAQGVAVANATGSTDTGNTETKLNELLASLRAIGIIAT